MIKSFNKTCRWKRGNVLVEFALILPVLITLILGTIEMGWAIFVQHTLVDAAREAARIASTQNVGTTQIQTAATDILTSASIPSAQATVNVSPSTVSLQVRGTPITVSVSIAYTNVSILPTPLFLGAKTLEASVTMAKEY